MKETKKEEEKKRRRSSRRRRRRRTSMQGGSRRIDSRHLRHHCCAVTATVAATITSTAATAAATTAAIARSKKGSGDDTTQRGRVCRLLLQSFARHTAKRFALCCCCWLPTVDCFSQSAGRPRARLVSTDESARRQANAEFSWRIDDRRRESICRARGAEKETVG